jgi:hypothetical protein
MTVDQCSRLCATLLMFCAGWNFRSALEFAVEEKHRDAIFSLIAGISYLAISAVDFVNHLGR